MLKVDDQDDGKRTPKPPAQESHKRAYVRPQLIPLGVKLSTDGKASHSTIEAGTVLGPS